MALLLNSNRTERRARIGRTGIALLTLALLPVIVATPSLAQKVPPTPPAPSTAFADAYDACTGAATNPEGIQSQLEADGWSFDEPYDEGPFASSISASKTVTNVGDIYFYVLYERYDTVNLVYCTYSIDGFNGNANLATAGDEFGLEGNTQETDTGTYGAWQDLGDEDGQLFRASQEDQYFWFQMNAIEPGGQDVTAPAPGGK